MSKIYNTPNNDDDSNNNTPSPPPQPPLPNADPQLRDDNQRKEEQEVLDIIHDICGPDVEFMLKMLLEDMPQYPLRKIIRDVVLHATATTLTEIIPQMDLYRAMDMVNHRLAEAEYYAGFAWNRPRCVDEDSEEWQNNPFNGKPPKSEGIVKDIVRLFKWWWKWVRYQDTATTTTTN